jgi:hypothetical protein
MNKGLIVGVDIGTTTAIAIFDLKNNLLSVESKREFLQSQIVNHILKFGKPLLIATDKAKPPIAISKLAASFNCKVFYPNHDLSVDEKENIIKVYVKSEHERDAMASAIFAYRSFAILFSTIDKTLATKHMEEFSDKAKEMIINKKVKNIADAIEKIKPKEKEEIIEKPYIPPIPAIADWKRKFEELRKSYDILKLYSEKLEERIKSLERQKQQLVEEEVKKNENARKEVLKEKEIRNRDILIKQLQYELSQLKTSRRIFEDQVKREEEINELKEAGLVPIIIIDNFTKEDVINAHKNLGIRDQAIWFKNFRFSKSTAKYLVSLRPKMIFGNIDNKIGNMLKEEGIQILNMQPRIKRSFAFLAEDEIEEFLKDSEKRSFLQWLDSYKNRVS